MKKLLILLPAAGCLFLGCGNFRLFNSTDTIQLTPRAFTYPRQVKRGTSIILEDGVLASDAHFNPGYVTVNARKKGNIDSITLIATGIYCGDCNPPPSIVVETINLEPIDSQAIYDVVMAPVFNVKCTTDVYDSVSDSTNYEYDVLTTNPLFNSDTLSLSATSDSSVTVPLIRVGDGHWKASFISTADSIRIFLNPLGVYQFDPFRLTKVDRFRICYIGSTERIY